MAKKNNIYIYMLKYTIFIILGILLYLLINNYDRFSVGAVFDFGILHGGGRLQDLRHVEDLVLFQKMQGYINWLDRREDSNYNNNIYFNQGEGTRSYDGFYYAHPLEGGGNPRGRSLDPYHIHIYNDQISRECIRRYNDTNIKYHIKCQNGAKHPRCLTEFDNLYRDYNQMEVICSQPSGCLLPSGIDLSCPQGSCGAAGGGAAGGGAAMPIMSGEGLIKELNMWHGEQIRLGGVAGGPSALRHYEPEKILEELMENDPELIRKGYTSGWAAIVSVLENLDESKQVKFFENVLSRQGWEKKNIDAVKEDIETAKDIFSPAMAVDEEPFTVQTWNESTNIFNTITLQTGDRVVVPAGTKWFIGNIRILEGGEEYMITFINRDVIKVSICNNRWVRIKYGKSTEEEFPNHAKIIRKIDETHEMIKTAHSMGVDIAALWKKSKDENYYPAKIASIHIDEPSRPSSPGMDVDEDEEPEIDDSNVDVVWNDGDTRYNKKISIYEIYELDV